MNSSLQSNLQDDSSLQNNCVVSGPHVKSVLAGPTFKSVDRHPVSLTIANEDSRDTVPRVWYNRGKMLMEKERYNAAIASFDMVLKSQPHDAKSLIWRGIALFHLNYYQSSLRDFRSATEIAPESRAAWIFQGVVLKALERHGAAIACYRTALLLQEQDKAEDDQYPLWV
jgi:tetratricopeptide (TPR) repeat protein